MLVARTLSFWPDCAGSRQVLLSDAAEIPPDGKLEIDLDFGAAEFDIFDDGGAALG